MIVNDTECHRTAAAPMWASEPEKGPPKGARFRQGSGRGQSETSTLAAAARSSRVPSFTMVASTSKPSVLRSLT